MDNEVKQDPFIGQKFGEGGHLEIISRVENTRKPEYLVLCSVCSEDPELFVDGIFRTRLSHLRNGSIPCGCSGSVKWTEHQTKVRLSRQCTAKGYTCLRVSEKWQNDKTIVSLSCGAHEWETKIGQFVRGRGNCPKCSSIKFGESMRKSDQEIASKFMSTGGFAEGTEFRRSSRKSNANKSYWDVICPICSTDQYAQKGLCSGVFSSATNALLNGCVSCRCSHNYRWTKVQREFQIREKLKSMFAHISFVDWLDGKTDSRAKIVINCKTHGNAVVNLQKFFAAESEICPSCVRRGFDKEKPGAFYVLRVVGRIGEFTGFGITNKIDDRLATHKRNLKKLGFVIDEMEIFETEGWIANSVERLVKNNFQRLPQEVEGFITEATHYHFYDDVVSFVDEQISMKEKYHEGYNLNMIDFPRGLNFE